MFAPFRALGLLPALTESIHRAPRAVTARSNRSEGTVRLAPAVGVERRIAAHFGPDTAVHRAKLPVQIARAPCHTDQLVRIRRVRDDHLRTLIGYRRRPERAQTIVRLYFTGARSQAPAPLR